jgi:hypothetical protein
MKKKLFIACLLALPFSGSTQNIGIGTTAPQTKLHIYGGASGVIPFAFSPLAIESNGHTYINILSPVPNEGAVLFGQPGNAASGGILYNNSSTLKGFQFRVNGNTTKMVLTAAGNLGIGTITPSARLQVMDSSVLFSATGDIPATPGLPPAEGPGRRMMWYADKAAFRAGHAGATHWNQEFIGNYSFAAGQSSSAIGNASTALGYIATAMGNNSVAIGFQPNASGENSVAIGFFPIATATGAVALGSGTNANGEYSTAMGYSTFAQAAYSTSMGVSSIASGDISTAMGNNTVASGPSSTAMGFQTLASGITAVAIGNGVTASGTNTIAIGTSLNATGNFSTALGNYASTNGKKGSFVIGDEHGLSLNSDANDQMLMRFFGGYKFNLDDNVLGMTLTAAGNLGIGTATADFPLSFAPVLGDKISLWGNSGNHYGLGIQNSLLQIHTDGLFSDIAFGYGSSGSFTEIMRVKGNGRVGIGINNPTSPLSFAATLEKKICLYPGATGDVGMAVQGNYLQIYADGAATTVGIGYQQNALVSGSNPTGFQYNLNVFGTGNATLRGTLTQLSDLRFKKDITHLQNSLQKIIQLNGYNYYWKDESADNSVQTGVLAQEVQKLFPQLVREDITGTLSVNYSGLIPVLIESIKEQQQQIDALKKLVEKSLK